MRVIICLDDNNGMLFNNRRQSRDRVLISDIIENLKGEKLCLNEFSLPLFSEYEEHIQVCSAPEKGKLFFLENLDLSGFSQDLREVTVYRWNRAYPADFTCQLDFSSYEIINETEFQGSSHDKITKLVYVKR